VSIKLRGGTLALALRLQEAMDSGDSLSANDIRTRLNDAINDQYRATGKWAYLIDSFGDAESGDVIYSTDGEVYRCPYEMSGGAGAQKCIIDFDKCEDVVPRTIYEVEADEGEHLAAMESARAAKLYGDVVPLYERFIGKSERENASSGSFAGKGKSFPILKAGDVAAAASSIGRAGADNYSTDVIKKNIIRIAKEKGWTSELPKAWQGDDKADAKESRPTAAVGTLKIREASAFPIDIELREALTTGKKIKLISPGPGATAYYTESALKQAAADKIFHAGLPMRIDHPTRAEEAARPEGSVKDWGAVLATDAAWMESYISAGKEQGPGLYSEVKPFSDHAKTIEEKGPYAGVSIMANGKQLHEAGRPVTKNGLPVLEKFTSAEGCDMVTRAGAGGLFLQESARDANQPQESDMTADEKRLLESLVGDKLRRDAISEAARVFTGVSVTEAQREYLMDNVLARPLPTTADGLLDATKFRESVSAELTRFGSAISGRPLVANMGAPAPVQLTEAQRTEQAEALKAEDQTLKEAWGSAFFRGDLKLAERAMKGRVQ